MTELPRAPQIVTFGCRLNAFESQVMDRLAREGGMTDAVIVNTCAVTAEAERQARQAIRKARRDKPDARIIVTGCAAQIDPGAYAGMPEVDQVVGNEEKLKRETFAFLSTEPVRVNDIMEARETAQHLIGGFEGRARALVQIQNGCDHRCTFCVIPYGRGNSRSVPLGAIVQQVRTLLESGYQEIVLTGVDITSYGNDLPGQPSLGQMVGRLLRAVPELPRLRLTSLDMVEVDDALFRLLAEEERLMPHLHLSLQAGDEMVLKRMKRRHSRANAIAFCEAARRARPDIVFGADIIAGFPTEDEAMFRNSLSLVEECDLTYLHVFPYSERPGTPAARMPQVSKRVRKARAARLREAGKTALSRYLDGLVGETVPLLAESDRRGRTDHYAVIETGAEMEPGKIYRARITGASDGRLRGAIV